MKETFLVAGGAGFIGVNFVKMLLEDDDRTVIVLDVLTYAGNVESLSEEIENGRIEFVRGDIADREVVDMILERFRPDYIVNFAAESHVDRSVTDPRPFVETNVLGTQSLLESTRRYIAGGGGLKKFVQISTDEVYGDLSIDFETPVYDGESSEKLGRKVALYGREVFRVDSPMRPSSPYSASKAAADMMALAYYRTYGLPVVVTRCSNNYGPYQFPEKLIPLMLNNIIEGRRLPVYGRGLNVRDWIHVGDHCLGVLLAAEKGRPGEIYTFGGYNERRNIDLVYELIDALGRPEARETIEFVGDRPGHDLRYAIDASKAMNELGWRPLHDFQSGLRSTVEWYLANRVWVKRIVDGAYRDYYEQMYSNR